MSRSKLLSQITEPPILSELETYPNQAVIWGILGDGNRGQVWELPGCKAIMLVEGNCEDPFVSIVGRLDVDDVKEAISLCPTNYPMIYCNPAYHHLFLAEGWDFNLRAQMAYTSLAPQNINPNWNIQPINDITLFERCLGYQSACGRYGSSSRFLKHGKGYVLCKGTEIVSEAYIDYQGHSYAEIGVITHPDYLRQGAAVQIASYLVNDCVKQGVTPVWSCQINNRASLQTGFKLGFRIERYYVSMVPKVGNTLGPPLEAWIAKNSLNRV